MAEVTKTIAAKAAISVSGAYPSVGSALSFNGSNGDYVEVSHNALLNITGAITMELWVKPRTWTGFKRLVHKYSSSFSTVPYEIGFDDDGLSAYVAVASNVDKQVVSVGNVDMNEWNHIAVVYDGENVKGFLNGVLVTEEPLTGTILTNSNSLFFAKRDSNYFTGLLDEIRIYGRACSEAEIKQHYAGIFNNNTDLVEVWHMNEGSGSTVTGSQNSLVGNITGAVWAAYGAPKFIAAKASIRKTDIDSLISANVRYPKPKVQISWDRSRNALIDDYQYQDESDYVMMVETFEQLEGNRGESVGSDADLVLANNDERFYPRAFKNKLKNPSFELNSSPTYWTASGIGAINIGTIRTRLRSYSFFQAGMLISDNIFLASGLGEEQIQSAEDWVFSMYFQGSGNARMKLFAFDETNVGGLDISTGLLASATASGIVLSGSWSRSQVSLNAPAGTVSLRATFELDSGGSSLYADDGMVEKGSTATAFQDIDENISHLLLPNRPVKIDIGFGPDVTASGVEYVRIFSGLTESIEPEVKDERVKIRCIDWSTKLQDKTVDSLMYVSYRTDELIEQLALAAGLNIFEYNLERGVLTIPFVWFNDEQSIWYWMKKVAEAEGGRIFFDREGVLRFWNRTHIENNKTSKYSFTFDSNMSDIKFEVNGDKVINKVVVRHKPREVQANQIIWILQGTEYIPAGSSLEYEIEVDDPCYSITEPTANVDYLANTESDGSGTDETSNVTISNFSAKANSASFTINNNSGSDIYITILQVKGEPATVIAEMETTVKDTESIETYREGELIIENDYIQTIDDAEAIAKKRIIQYRNPLDFLEIDVVGNPQIEVGDVVTVQDSYTGTTKDLYVVANRISFEDEVVQHLTLESRVVNF